MGLLDGLMGNASEIDIATIEAEFKQILTPSERTEKAYQLIRDTIVFTDKRLIYVDRQGLSGKKVEYQSIPYGKIVRFSVETAGSLDLDAELKIWVGGNPTPIGLKFNKKLNIYTVQGVLASYVLR
jgi:Bacterial PH domain